MAETIPELAWSGPFVEVFKVKPFVEIPVVDAYGNVFAVVVVAVIYPIYRGKVEVETNLVPSYASNVLFAKDVAFVPPLPIAKVPPRLESDRQVAEIA